MQRKRKKSLTIKEIAEALEGEQVNGICDWDSETEFEYFNINEDDAKRLAKKIIQLFA